MEDETLAGVGPGKSASNRLKAFLNKLLQARTLIVSEDYDGARQQVMSALKKTDGEMRPPDFVDGSAAQTLADMLRELAGLTVVPRGMVLIPGGTNSGTDPDFGAYSLTVTAFYMDKYEVTKTLWDEVWAWGHSNGYTDLPTGEGKAANHPVQTVSWYDVVKWCNARSEKAGLTPAYYINAGFSTVYRTGTVSGVDLPYVDASADGYRLPTYEEWEYAARGGAVSHRFPWSDTNHISHARANYRASGGEIYDDSDGAWYHPTYATGGLPYTSPVGEFAANGYGLYDMSGNVFEWCYDWNPGFEGLYRVFPGGCWSLSANYSRVGFRYFYPPHWAYDHLGFRAVLPPGQY